MNLPPRNTGNPFYSPLLYCTALVLLSSVNVLAARASDEKLEFNKFTLRLGVPAAFESAPPEGVFGLVDIGGAYQSNDSGLSFGAVTHYYGRPERGGYEECGIPSPNETFSNRLCEIDLNDTYLFFSRGGVYFSAGNQKVNWSYFNELGAFNLFNPEDLRQSWVQGRNSRRISTPLLKLKADFTDNLNIEAVVSPFAFSSRLPLPGEKWFPVGWEIPQTYILTGNTIGVQTNYSNLDLIPISDSVGGGLKLQYLMDSSDISLILYYGYSPQPALSIASELVSNNGKLYLNQKVLPVMRKITVEGVSYSSNMGQATIFLELAFSQGKPFTDFQSNFATLSSLQQPGDKVYISTTGDEGSTAVGINYSAWEFDLSLRGGLTRGYNMQPFPTAEADSSWYQALISRSFRTVFGNVDSLSSLFWEANTGNGMFSETFELNITREINTGIALFLFPGYSQNGYIGGFHQNNELLMFLEFNFI